MAIDSRFFMHDSDRLALQALQAIPGFTQLFKAFMKVWSEKQFRIENMSSNLRVSQQQLKKYHDMLPPICERLGIPVPDLYVTLDVNPNAYTYGDSDPFIVITTGMLETVPQELIPTVLAHECGHIACRHCLYTTMGDFVLSEAISLLGLDGIAVLPIQVAFYYWMRCSEFSADRAAALCDGGPDKTIRLCMHLAGYDRDMDAEANVEAFMQQALEYKEMVDNSKWDKTLEFLALYNRTHPLTALRAYECNEWAKTQRFHQINAYLAAGDCTEEAALALLSEIPITEPAKFYIGKPLEEVMEHLRRLGFRDIRPMRTTQRSGLERPGQVSSILINGRSDFQRFQWFPTTAVVDIWFYEPPTEEEIAAAHPDRLQTPESSAKYALRTYEEAVEDFRNAGFTNITLECLHKGKRGWLSREGAIVRITVDGITPFDKGVWFPADSNVHIVYNSYDED